MIFITGASSGIGKSTAEIFAKQGRALFLVARRIEKLQEIKSHLEKTTQSKVEIAPLDVTDRNAVEKFGTQHQTLLSQVEVLVNNAGLAKGREPIQEGKLSDWDTMIDTNVKGFLYITHLILPHFLKKQSGHIVNLGSVAGRWSYPNGNVYSATKRAVASLTESLRLDLHGKGIRVTEVAPGMVETDFSLVRFGDPEKAKAVYNGMEALSAQDIAEIIEWTVNRPKHVNIQEVVVFPTDQSSVNNLFRRKLAPNP